MDEAISVDEPGSFTPDVEMADPPKASQSKDLDSLRLWLNLKRSRDLIGEGLRLETVPSPILLKKYIELAKLVFPAEFPPWLELSMSDSIIPSTFEEPFQTYGHDADVVEKLIWKIWHVSNRRDSSAGSSSSARFTSDFKAKLLHTAFKAQYRGDTPARFCEILSKGYAQWYNPAWHYGRILATVQSSATGKTRLFYEIGEKLIPTFTLCFREHMNGSMIDPSQGWPYGDWALAQYFQPSALYTSEEMAAAFLGQLFKALAMSAQNDINCFAQLAPSLDLAIRDAFLTSVCTNARNVLVSLARDDEGLSPWCHRLFEHYVEQDAETLRSKLTNRSQYIGADFLLVIDECTQLDKRGAREMVDGDPDSASFLTGLRRIMKAGDQKTAISKFWMILLDTHGETYTLYPVSRERASSARFTEGTHVALPPWINLGYDVNMPSSPPDTPTQALSLNWLKKGGRPYWEQLQASTVLTEAAAKLFCGDLDSTNLQHVVAAMSRRIHLPLSNDSANTPVHLAAVGKHLRYMKSIGWEDGIVKTAAPSEPVLSIATAKTLLGSVARYSRVTTTFLDHLLRNERLVERGRLGETLAALVLTLGRDAATCSFPPSDEYGSNFVGGTIQEPAINPVTATQFVVSLFGTVSTEFRKFGDKAWLNFTHFDLYPQILAGQISAHSLQNAWCRGVAYQFADNQPIYDLLIPMYLGLLDQPFDLTKLSYLVIQVKAKVEAAGKGILQSLTGPVIILGSGSHKPRYIAVLMDLGTIVAFRGQKSQKVQAEDVPASVPQPTQNKKFSSSVLSHYVPNEPSRWVFHARGLTSETYPFLPEFGGELMHRVLYGSLEDDVVEGRQIVQDAAVDWFETLNTVLTI